LASALQLKIRLTAHARNKQIGIIGTKLERRFARLLKGCPQQCQHGESHYATQFYATQFLANPPFNRRALYNHSDQ
jgi:hypothetical protein